MCYSVTVMEGMCYSEGRHVLQCYSEGKHVLQCYSERGMCYSGTEWKRLVPGPLHSRVTLKCVKRKFNKIYPCLL